MCLLNILLNNPLFLLFPKFLELSFTPKNTPPKPKKSKLDKIPIFFGTPCRYHNRSHPFCPMVLTIARNYLLCCNAHTNKLFATHFTCFNYAVSLFNSLFNSLTIGIAQLWSWFKRSNKQVKQQ